jgi:5-methyltetrahydrofolate--homocysteine methyltransferase
MTTSILDFLAERVLVIDGAMGTQIQQADLTLDDFAGHENCSEILNETRPDFVRGVHDAYLEAGAMAVETNTFGANKIVLAEFGLEGKTHELNLIGARLARECCDRCATGSDPRFVIGSVGPGTKLPTLGHTDYDTLVDSYAEQVRGLLEGGIDAVLIETCQDILQTKAAIAAANRAFRDRGRRVPIFCQVTMETTGTMLVGTDIAAALTAIEPFDEVSVFGLNCATGPQEMSEHVAHLGKYSPKPVSVVPNAGLPQLVEGKTHYPLTPKELASWLVRFIEDDGVAMVGGCCGTTPEHIREVARAVGKRSPGKRSPQFVPSLSSIYSAVPIVQDASYLIIGERTNVLGSKKFKDAFTAGDMDGMVAVAKAEVREGCHLIDVCADQTGRDARQDLIPILKAVVTQVPVPICVDSNSWTTFEPGLKLLGGRSLVNSLNLENGEEELVRYLEVVKSFGAAVILGTIDEDREAGMAKTAERKVSIARRLLEIATRKCGLRPWDIFFDPLVLPISTGQEEARRNAVETIEGIRRIKAELPGTFTAVGLSNVSFGLKPAARHVLNSVFLHYCREAGLDAAIVHASKIVPLYRIDPRERELAEDLVFDRRRAGYDPLTEFMTAFGGKRTAAAEKESRPASVEERLKARIIDGDRVGLEEDLALALEKHKPLDIINVFLLDGMKVVGDLFGSGQMQLPFVLQSAETMKAAVSWLEPHMEKVEGDSKGRIVLATVKGDVHDIGKNLVDIILSNNGYTVHNLGIKQPITNILDEAKRREAHAVGLSGLLVKSTVVMKENLEEMERQGVRLPVLLGGAALTRRYVEIDCRRSYAGRVEYGKDAFEALALMDSVMGAEGERPSRYPGGRGYDARAAAAGREDAGEEAAAPVAVATATAPERAGPAAGERAPAIPARFERPVEEAAGAALPSRAEVRRDVPVPGAPFLGPRVVERIALDAVLPYLNENVLFKFQWQFKQKKMAREEYERFIEREVRPIYRDLVRRCKEERILEPRAVYGYFECQAEGDDVLVYRPGTSDVLHRFSFPRQKKHKRLCIADFFRPVGSGEKDLIAFTVVTMGARASEVERQWFAENRYRDYLYLHGLSVEAAEALAEFIHRQVRVELEIAGDDSRDIAGLFRQGYRGSRYSFGYPACPRLEDQAPLLEVLDAKRIGVTLSEEFMLEPEQSTSALIVHHPQAKYFNA